MSNERKIAGWNVKVTVKGEKITVWSEFTNTSYTGKIGKDGFIRTKDSIAMKMIRKVKEAGMLEGLI